MQSTCSLWRRCFLLTPIHKLPISHLPAEGWGGGQIGRGGAVSHQIGRMFKAMEQLDLNSCCSLLIMENISWSRAKMCKQPGSLRSCQWRAAPESCPTDPRLGVNKKQIFILSPFLYFVAWCTPHTFFKGSSHRSVQPLTIKWNVSLGSPDLPVSAR